MGSNRQERRTQKARIVWVKGPRFRGSLDKRGHFSYTILNAVNKRSTVSPVCREKAAGVSLPRKSGKSLGSFPPEGQ